MNTRVDPIGDLNDFKPAAKPAKPVAREQIDKLSTEAGFPSRQAAPSPAAVTPRSRRYTTGRDKQINIKATAETIAQLNRYADDHRIPLGEVLRLAMEALEATTKAK